MCKNANVCKQTPLREMPTLPTFASTKHKSRPFTRACVLFTCEHKKYEREKFENSNLRQSSPKCSSSSSSSCLFLLPLSIFFPLFHPLFQPSFLSFSSENTVPEVWWSSGHWSVSLSLLTARPAGSSFVHGASPQCGLGEGGRSAL